MIGSAFVIALYLIPTWTKWICHPVLIANKKQRLVSSRYAMWYRKGKSKPSSLQLPNLPFMIGSKQETLKLRAHSLDHWQNIQVPLTWANHSCLKADIGLKTFTPPFQPQYCNPGSVQMQKSRLNQDVLQPGLDWFPGNSNVNCLLSYLAVSLQHWWMDEWFPVSGTLLPDLHPIWGDPAFVWYLLLLIVSNT